MTTQDVLDAGLRASLPAPLHILVPDIARLLADVESGALPPEQARARLADPTLLHILRNLIDPLSSISIQVGNIVNSSGIAIGPNARVTYQGPGYPRPNYRSEIASRLSFYGTVFVGRESLLTEIMQPAIPAPAYSLILAPAGFGKSALSAQLVHRWEQSAWPDPRPALLYFFTRQETAENTLIFFLQRINAQLLNLLPQFEGGVPNELESLRSQFSQLWTVAVNRVNAASPLVLVVDGLDEMASGDVTIASLLPDFLPPYVRMIVTSRLNPDPRTLVPVGHPLRSAAPLKLDAFVLSEIEQLLKLGGLAPSSVAALAPKVLDLTRGEPLFARFVSQEVVQAGRIPDHLAKQRPQAIRDYFKLQLDLVTKSASGGLARDVLGLLVVARAGLSRADVAAILESEPLDIKLVIEQIKRFLLGEERFELMHLELRQAIAAEYSDQRLGHYRQLLLDWCARYGKSGWPDNAPIYVVEQYAKHLEAAGLIDERHYLVIDPAFRAVQRNGLGDIGTTLADVRTALRAALDLDRIARIVECAAAYRETLRHGRLSETIFSALDAGDSAGALRRAAICGTDSDWAHVLWAYIAWELALAGQAGPAQRALAAISEAAAPPLGDLHEALLVCTARALAGAEGRDAVAWLAVWGRAADAQQLLGRYRVADPVDLVAEIDALDNLGKMADHLTAQAADDARSGLYDLLSTLENNNEEDTQRVSDLRESLVHFAAHPEGRQIIEQFVSVTLPNPYPFYRNHALATLGIAALAAPVTTEPSIRSWVSRQLRAMLAVALYGEGVTFTFDLPAMLLGIPHPDSPPAAELKGMVDKGLNQIDRWGTHLRAGSAQAIARYRFDKSLRLAAADQLRDVLTQPLGYAGYAAVSLVAIANRCLEMGLPLEQVLTQHDQESREILEAASQSAGYARDMTFRARRVLLVHAYRSEWLLQPPPPIAELPSRFARMPDRDMRLAYIDHLAARWAAPGEANWLALKEIVLFSLSDATTLDAILARLVGQRCTALSPDDVQRIIAACARDLATGRPWEYGARVSPNDPSLVP